ncbi:hypothetical protein B0J13DRAFT_254221 [Dactylonectria estremocensis]|uniref:Uncharacterized protein n=1 Tax=Dactylonectria estremocensis TaxID=1079267 RepID=A0A9P9JA30_9HYPO|nr:hypothetical protein B0J13DRAFT_254221 [Dactylonectria estremocensis]
MVRVCCSRDGSNCRVDLGHVGLWDNMGEDGLERAQIPMGSRSIQRPAPFSPLEYSALLWLYYGSNLADELSTTSQSLQTPGAWRSLRLGGPIHGVGSAICPPLDHRTPLRAPCRPSRVGPKPAFIPITRLFENRGKIRSDRHRSSKLQPRQLEAPAPLDGIIDPTWTDAGVREEVGSSVAGREKLISYFYARNGFPLPLEFESRQDNRRYPCRSTCECHVSWSRLSVTESSDAGGSLVNMVRAYVMSPTTGMNHLGVNEIFKSPFH